MIAGLQPGDTFADLLDDPGALVPAYQREPRHDVAVPQMLIRMAQARGHVADEHLARLGRIQVQLGDLEVLACPRKTAALVFIDLSRCPVNGDLAATLGRSGAAGQTCQTGDQATPSDVRKCQFLPDLFR